MQNGPSSGADPVAPGVRMPVVELENCKAEPENLGPDLSLGCASVMEPVPACHVCHSLGPLTSNLEQAITYFALFRQILSELQVRIVQANFKNSSSQLYD